MTLKNRLVKSMQNNEHCPAHRNCAICTFKNGKDNQCAIMETADKLLSEGWTIDNIPEKKPSVCVEIDVDGVIANLLGSDHMKKKLAKCLPGWDESLIFEYSMSSLKMLNPIAYDLLWKSIADPEYIRNVPKYGGVLESCIRLLETGDIAIHFHTMINTSPECVAARTEWLNDLICKIKFHNETACVTKTVDVGKKTMFTSSDYLIEDCPTNLERSNAHTKILIKKRYNTEWAAQHPEVICVSSFIEAVDWIVSHR